MNDIVIKTLRGMTDGYFVNIGQAEDTSILETEYKWDGLYLNDVTQPLHNMLEVNRSSGLIHYLTIHERFDALSLLKPFFETIASIPGWKRRIIIMKIPHSDITSKYLSENDYTFIISDKEYDYFIHTIWDILI